MLCVMLCYVIKDLFLNALSERAHIRWAMHYFLLMLLGDEKLFALAREKN